MPERRQQRDDQ